MKRLFAIVLLSLCLLPSCKKDQGDEAPPTYEDRLEGSWDLVAVSYSTVIPNFQDPTQAGFPVAGDGTEVSGSFELRRNPHEVDFNFSFNASVMGFPSIPVQRSGSGSWTTTSDEKMLIVTTDDGESYQFEVLVNEPKQQIFAGNFTETFNNLFSLEVETELEFSRP